MIELSRLEELMYVMLEKFVVSASIVVSRLQESMMVIQFKLK